MALCLLASSTDFSLGSTGRAILSHGPGPKVRSNVPAHWYLLCFLGSVFKSYFHGKPLVAWVLAPYLKQLALLLSSMSGGAGGAELGLLLQCNCVILDLQSCCLPLQNFLLQLIVFS